MAVEFRYLDISWNEKREVVKIDASENSIEIEEEQGCFILKTVTFPKYFNYVGLSIENQIDNSVNPYIKLASGEQLDLLKVVDPMTNKCWWIQANGWDNKLLKYQSELYRTVGRVEVIAAGQQYLLENDSVSFSVEELEYYLNDFKDSLLMLILNNNNPAKVKVNREVPNCFNDDLFRLLTAFTENIEKLIQKPNILLSEIQERLPLKKVKPVIASFKELSLRPNSKTLLSRSFKESFNTAENQYIHYCVNRVQSLLKILHKLAVFEEKKLDKRIEQHGQVIHKLKTQTTKKINPKVFDSELKVLEREIYPLIHLSESLERCNHVEFNEEKHLLLGVKLGKQQPSWSSHKRFYVNDFLDDDKDFEEFKRKYGLSYVVIDFPLDSPVVSLAEENIDSKWGLAFKEIWVSGIVKKQKKTNSYGNQYATLEYVSHIKISSTHVTKRLLEQNLITVTLDNQFKGNMWGYFLKEKNLGGNSSVLISDDINSIDNISLKGIQVVFNECFVALETARTGNQYIKLYVNKLIDINLQNNQAYSRYSKLLTTRRELEQANWIVGLDKQDIEDNKNETLVLGHELEGLKRTQQIFKEFSVKTQPLSMRLAQVQQFFKKNAIAIRNTASNSMVFVQNPFYANTKKNYLELLALDGIDARVLETLLAVDEIGIVNVSNLYEKWVLLQIIKVLTERYAYQFVNADWKLKLIDAVLSNKYDIELSLEHSNSRQRLNLFYEKILANNKRPDFVIEDALSESKLVIDAKFKENINEKALNTLLDELAVAKDYSEQRKNFVFIAHPKIGINEEISSPLDWGIDCNYGQTTIFNNDSQEPRIRGIIFGEDYKVELVHAKGAILLTPSLEKTDTLDNLQRLVGMYLQQSPNRRLAFKKEENSLYLGNKENWICIACGNYNQERFKFDIKSTMSGKNKFDVSCVDCNQRTVQTFCLSCQHTLFKNGLKWTYHRTKSSQFTNVVCPRCGVFL